MKKSIFLCLSLLWMSAGAFAQNFGLGVRGGVNLSTNLGGIASTDTVSAEAITGLNLAVLAEIPLIGRLSIQPEIQYVQKGRKLDFPQTETLEEASSYLQVPILLRYNIGPEAFKIYGLAGPNFGYALTKYINGNQVDFDKESNDANQQKDVRFEFSLILGAGVGVKLGPGRLFADFRYEYDLNETVQYENDRPSNIDPSVYQSFGITAGYLFIF